MIDPWWIVIAVSGWIGLGIFMLTVLWKTWTGLSRCLGLMYANHLMVLRKFGFPAQNPMSNTLSLSKGYGRTRIFLKLLIWGAPQISETPREAYMAIRSARIWSALGVTFWVLAFTGLSFLAIEFLWLFIAGNVIYLMILRPAPWR
ncbi:hypothetical protein SAMN05444358_103179 [Ruegeria halocynthiae]|uniref:Uncharacterized protein n=2 Tax=Ruegeria halocynthiae TaxID=985054 RepID=A0A1H2ZEA6_9RHOB|nr:hypothetical protein SAMN05444358_103179 [Ruegeria halocynthiae]